MSKFCFFIYGLAIVCVFGSSQSGSSPSTSSQCGVRHIASGIPSQRGRETQVGSSVFFSSLGETPSKHGSLCTKQVSFPRIPALEEGTFMDLPPKWVPPRGWRVGEQSFAEVTCEMQMQMEIGTTTPPPSASHKVAKVLTPWDSS